MDSSTPIWITQGAFGRATVNVTHRALVEHAHKEFNILFKLSGTDTAFRSNGRTLALDDHSLLLFNPWVPHAKLPNESGVTTILSLLIEPTWLVRVLATPVPRVERLFPNVREEISAEVSLHANRLAAAVASGPTRDEASCTAFLADLVDAVTREYADPNMVRDIASNARPIDYRIRNALVYIHQHASLNPRMDDVARHVGLSRSRFFEQFRHCVGISPQHYLDWARVKLATNWLSTTNRPLTELADQLGFDNQSNFTRFFTQHMGVSPSEFRRQTTTVVVTSEP